MSAFNQIFKYVFILVLASFFYGCYDPTGPIPEIKKTNTLNAPSYTREALDLLVSTEQVTLSSPLVNINGDLPQACNSISFIRIKLIDGPKNASDADAALMMMPGVLEGANAFLYLGKNIVYQAKTMHGKNFEVWALDRRNNCLEDRTGFDLAEKFDDVKLSEKALLDYYYRDKPINGRKFSGFLVDEDIPFISEFGLSLDMNDMHHIARTMMPDASLRKQKLFVGGHSQGGPFASIYAGWDFDGNALSTNDVGYQQIAGLFGFDTSTRKLDESNNSDISQILGSVIGIQQPLFGELAYQIALNKVRTKGPRTISIPNLTTELMALTEAIGILAYKAPEQEHTVLQDIPISDSFALVLSAFYSRATEDIFLPPFLTDYRFTNEALMGIVFDEHLSILSFLHVSLGHLNGGSVVKKETGSAPVNTLYIGNDAGPDLFQLGQGPLYTWADYSEIGDKNDPYYTSEDGSVTYTDISNEMVATEDFAHILFSGESNLVEWYYSVRRLLDLSAVTMPWSVKYGLFYLHGEQADKHLPSFDFVAQNRNTRDAVTDLDGQHKTLVIPGMEHMDPMFAIANQPDRYENPVINNLIEYVITTQIK
jgi:hypothetical protein